ncbi:MAG TPA: hypothetical protein VLS89_00680 [Candidatus Nanopelagicales bacterium]|nr:hypothetical protein [Candidatus Nanopelagicales bacterium]
MDRAPESLASPRCAQCGRGIPPRAATGPRLVLLCKRCRSEERPTEEEIVSASTPEPRPRGLLRRRWSPRMMLRVLLFALAICLALIRLLEP